MGDDVDRDVRAEPVRLRHAGEHHPDQQVDGKLLEPAEADAEEVAADDGEQRQPRRQRQGQRQHGGLEAGEQARHPASDSQWYSEQECSYLPRKSCNTMVIDSGSVHVRSR